MDEVLFPNAHPMGAKPFTRPDYIDKLKALSEEIITLQECNRFIDLVQRLPQLSIQELAGLNLEVDSEHLRYAIRDQAGIF